MMPHIDYYLSVCVVVLWMCIEHILGQSSLYIQLQGVSTMTTLVHLGIVQM